MERQADRDDPVVAMIVAGDCGNAYTVGQKN